MNGWEILQHTGRLHRAVLRDAAPCLDRHGLFRMAPFVLAKVRARETPSAMAAALGLPLPTLSHILRRLEEQGWVFRQPDPADLRRFRFSLTASGERALRAARECLSAAMERYVARLDPRERDELLRLLSRMLEEDEGAGNHERTPAR